MTGESKQKELLYCSFCEKSQDEVKKLIAGPAAFICDECIELCHSIVREGEGEGSTKDSDDQASDVPTPREISSFLDKYVVGQDYAKMVISVAVHNHYERLKHPIIDDIEIEKSNIVMFGPTGSGKTLIAKTIAKMLHVPFYIADATALTEAGYVGDDVETILSGLLQAANGDIEMAQKGIIFLDEVDKKSSRADSPSITRDVSGEGVQQALLKMIEGTVARIPAASGRKHPQQEMIEIDTTNILFIVSGAFVKLDKIVDIRIHKDRPSMGVGAMIRESSKSKDIFDILSQTEPEDLIEFGLIPELIGRLPIIAPLAELTEKQLVKVLVQPKNAIVKQFKSMFRLKNVDLSINEKGLHEIAKVSRKKGTGARGLRNVLEHKLMPIQYELPELSKQGLTTVEIDEEVIQGMKAPVKIFKPITK